MIVDLIVDTFSGLSDSARMMVIVGLRVVYSGAELAGKRHKRFRISSRARLFMTVAFIIAVLQKDRSWGRRRSPPHQKLQVRFRSFGNLQPYFSIDAPQALDRITAL